VKPSQSSSSGGVVALFGHRRDAAGVPHAAEQPASRTHEPTSRRTAARGSRRPSRRSRVDVVARLGRRRCTPHWLLVLVWLPRAGVDTAPRVVFITQLQPSSVTPSQSSSMTPSQRSVIGPTLPVHVPHAPIEQTSVPARRRRQVGAAGARHAVVEVPSQSSSILLRSRCGLTAEAFPVALDCVSVPRAHARRCPSRRTARCAGCSYGLVRRPSVVVVDAISAR
jgi:hypothetical protein